MTAHHFLQKAHTGLFVRSAAGEALFKKGNELYARNNITEAINEWNKAVEVYHHPEACIALGRCYDFGEGTKADQKKAFALYKQAAKLGSAAGMYNVGACLRLGAGVEKDDKKALKYFIRAHKNGYANACVNIGMMYLKGDGVKLNVQKAVKFFQIGVQNDIPTAQYTLGLLYLSDDSDDLELLLEREREHVTEIEKQKTRTKTKTTKHHGIPTNKMEGVTLLHLAAARGHAGASQYLQELGILRVNAPKASHAVDTPRLKTGDASNLISQLGAQSGSVRIQAAKTLSYLIGGYKPNLDVLLEDSQLCHQLIDVIATTTNLELLEWMLAIVEAITQSEDESYRQTLVSSGILPQLIRLLEFAEIASRVLSVVFLLVDGSTARKRELRALGMTLEVKEISSGTCNMVIKHGSFAEEILQRQQKGRLA